MKASLIKTAALASGFACLTALSVGPAVAGDKDIAQTGKTRAEVRAEYHQAVREGTLPHTGDMNERTYRAMIVRGSPIKGDKDIAQTGKTRAEVRTEYHQAVREGALPHTVDMNEMTYRAMIVSGSPIKGDKDLSATAPTTTPLTREAVRADTLEWLRLHRGDVQMGGQ